LPLPVVTRKPSIASRLLQVGFKSDAGVPQNIVVTEQLRKVRDAIHSQIEEWIQTVPV
jgi:N-acetylmuramoyl-L-alanine amidase